MLESCGCLWLTCHNTFLSNNADSSCKATTRQRLVIITIKTRSESRKTRRSHSWVNMQRMARRSASCILRGPRRARLHSRGSTHRTSRHMLRARLPEGLHGVPAIRTKRTKTTCILNKARRLETSRGPRLGYAARGKTPFGLAEDTSLKPMGEHTMDGAPKRDHMHPTWSTQGMNYHAWMDLECGLRACEERR